MVPFEFTMSIDIFTAECGILTRLQRGNMKFSFWTFNLGKFKVTLASKIDNPCIRGASENWHVLRNDQTTVEDLDWCLSG